MTLPKKLEFLKSVRFWKLFAVATVQFLATQNIITADAADAITILLAGSVVVRTIDKAGENIMVGLRTIGIQQGIFPAGRMPNMAPMPPGEITAGSPGRPLHKKV